jgi:membrane-bound lytic murein transglycosylase B
MRGADAPRVAPAAQSQAMPNPLFHAFRRPLLAALLCAAVFLPGAHAAPDKRGIPYAARDDAMRLADEIAERRRLDRAWVRAAIGNARLLPVVKRLMQPAPAGTVKNWTAYRDRTIDPARVQAGARFWRDNAATLARAQAEFGVPADIIVGILGVETVYGRAMGDFRVIDALATLAFDFPSAHPKAGERQAFFRGELESFLDAQSRAGADPTLPVGSYAGATGMPQFMPGSIARYAVDYDGDGRIDLVNNPSDVIGSVANYFRAFGWQPGVPPVFAVSFDESRLAKSVLLAPDIVPTFSADAFVAGGAVLRDDALRFKGLFALIELQNGGDPPSYVAGTQNFYVITRYNWSSYYAMSVIELGRAVRAAMEQHG